MSNVGTDGWVRVEWDNGVRNSYRMGKDGKYDLKLAQDVQHFGEVDKDENGSEKGEEWFFVYLTPFNFRPP